MRDFFAKLFSKEPPSREQANERLRVVLAYDRKDANSKLTETMDTLKEEIIQLITKHFEIDGTPEVTLATEGRHSALDINISIKGRPVNIND